MRGLQTACSKAKHRWGRWRLFEDPEKEEAGYLDTVQGQFIAGAVKYLTAARIITQSAEYSRRRSVLVVPALHNTAHGAELLLKFPLIRGGVSVEAVRVRYGHNLWKLYSDPANGSLRLALLEEFSQAWSAAAESGQYVDDFTNREPNAAFEDALALLGELHGSSTSYALRYIVAPHTKGPSAGMLLDALLPVAERLVRNSSLLDFWPGLS